MMDQTNIFDALATLDPTLTLTMEPEPGWVWTRCPVCAEVRYQRRAGAGGRCIMTPGCPGKVAAWLEALCVVCGKPVTARRRGKDVSYCSQKCETAR